MPKEKIQASNDELLEERKLAFGQLQDSVSKRASLDNKDFQPDGYTVRPFLCPDPFPHDQQLQAKDAESKAE